MDEEQKLLKQAAIARSQSQNQKAKQYNRIDNGYDATIIGYSAPTGQNLIQRSDGSISYAGSDTNGAIAIGDTVPLHSGTMRVDGLSHYKQRRISPQIIRPIATAFRLWIHTNIGIIYELELKKGRVTLFKKTPAYSDSINTGISNNYAQKQTNLIYESIDNIIYYRNFSSSILTPCEGNPTVLFYSSSAFLGIAQSLFFGLVAYEPLSGPNSEPYSRVTWDLALVGNKQIINTTTFSFDNPFIPNYSANLPPIDFSKNATFTNGNIYNCLTNYFGRITELSLSSNVSPRNILAVNLLEFNERLTGGNDFADYFNSLDSPSSINGMDVINVQTVFANIETNTLYCWVMLLDYLPNIPMSQNILNTDFFISTNGHFIQGNFPSFIAPGDILFVDAFRNQTILKVISPTVVQIAGAENEEIGEFILLSDRFAIIQTMTRQLRSAIATYTEDKGLALYYSFPDKLRYFGGYTGGNNHTYYYSTNQYPDLPFEFKPSAVVDPRSNDIYLKGFTLINTNSTGFLTPQLRLNENTLIKLSAKKKVEILKPKINVPTDERAILDYNWALKDLLYADFS